ncbi:amidohydrolase family protein [Novosphingobium flavum]|uniref:Amidohydrolase family protein n=1 Tax=Novosphingobium flavum TaxID=1778672 RepID=A0A7X1FUS5_9SPHN|nr:amidohydrolase family protein [Novosphingobium flavum]MBC2666727.1 amidohydrolase family protein [Novosphingobium flavum]
MKRKISWLFGAVGAVLACAASANTPEKTAEFLAPADRVVAIKAGRLYDPKGGQLLANQVVIIRGDRIENVGTNLPVPANAKVIDLGNATVMPGMIDAHVHTNVDASPTTSLSQRVIWMTVSAQHDLDAGFTTILDLDSRGGFDTVELRDMINAGHVLGPRMQVVGQALNFRNSNYVREGYGERWYAGRTENKDINGPWLARAAVREAKNHGVDYVKVYATSDYVGPNYMWRDGKFQYVFSISTEEVQAIVDEAHRLGLKVACHSYSGNGKDPCLLAGVDNPNHLLELDAAGVKLIQQFKTVFTPTIDDLTHLDPLDLQASGGAGSRLALGEAAVRRARAAGLEIAFGSGATSPPGGEIPHGKQGNQFAYLVKWGMTPAEALRTTYVGAVHVLNYDMERHIGSLEKGKYADVIAVSGDPLADITEMERVKFVMKGGMVVKDAISRQR